MRIKKYIDILNSFIYRNKYTKRNLKDYPDIEKNENAWYLKYDVIAHSGGGIGGYKKTNSRESWEYAYHQGTRVFDADLSFTCDNIIVLRHEWSDDLNQDNISEDRIPTYDEFMKTLIFQKYHPMSIYDVVDFMNAHDDVFVACDFKDGVEILESLISSFKEKESLQLFDRVIISLYSYDDYYKANELYSFINYAIRQYEELPHNYYELCEFCLKERIPVCMITRNYIKEGDRFNVLTKKGITVFVATVNDLKRYKKYRRKGVKGIVSDFLNQNQLS